MSKKSEAFIDKYVVGQSDWLLKHKEVIAKLLDEYETEQLTIPVVVGQSEQFFLFYKELQKAGRLYNDNMSDKIMIRDIEAFVKNK